VGHAAGALRKVAGRERAVAHPLSHPRSGHEIPRELRHRLSSEGIEITSTLFRTPNAHAVAEHTIRSVRRDVLERLLIVSEWRPRQVRIEYVACDNQHWPHQSLGQRCAAPSAPASVDSIVATFSATSSMLMIEPRLATPVSAIVRCRQLWSAGGAVAQEPLVYPGHSASNASGPLTANSEATQQASHDAVITSRRRARLVSVHIAA